MIALEIPGWTTAPHEHLELEHLVLDLNGTLALDGQILPGVAERLVALSAHLTVYLVTADTRGQAEDTSKRLGCQFVRIEPGHEASQKQALVERLGMRRDLDKQGGVIAIGNGANDAGMLSAAALCIAVLGPEGLAVEALLAANVVVAGIEDALDLLLQPQRLVATLRR